MYKHLDRIITPVLTQWSNVLNQRSCFAWFYVYVCTHSDDTIHNLSLVSHNSIYQHGVDCQEASV